MSCDGKQKQCEATDMHDGWSCLACASRQGGYCNTLFDSVTARPKEQRV
jgi:hypothetical protein